MSKPVKCLTLKIHFWQFLIEYTLISPPSHKGGSWVSTGDEASRFSRFSFRRHFFQHLGFRLVRSPPDRATPTPVKLCSSEVFVLGVGITGEEFGMMSSWCNGLERRLTHVHHKHTHTHKDNPTLVPGVKPELSCQPSTNPQFQYDSESALDTILEEQHGQVTHEHTQSWVHINLRYMAFSSHSPMQGFVWEHLVSFPDQYTKLLIVWASDSGNETDTCFRHISIALCGFIWYSLIFIQILVPMKAGVWELGNELYIASWSCVTCICTSSYI